MKTSDILLSETEKLWSEYNEHPFVKGIEKGTLNEERFRYYIIQDYLYLIEYAKIFGLGVAKAESLETLKLFTSYINAIVSGETDIHRGYMKRLKISEEEIMSAKPSLNSLSYTSYMLRIAYEGGEAEILSAILACALSYEYIAKNIVKNNPESLNHLFYGDWIKGYSDIDYRKNNISLKNTFDKLTEGLPENRITVFSDIFKKCSEYELLFWDLVWNMN